MVSEENKALFDFFADFELVNIGISVITNLILIYLILYRSSQEIGAYRYLLLAFAINDIYFPLIHLITLPVICSYKDAFVMFSHGIFTSRISICLFACTFSQTMPLLAHLFIYRLIATKWPRHLQFYTGGRCFFMVTLTVIVESSMWFTNCYFNYGPDQETIDYVQSFLEGEFTGEGEGFIGALYYSVEGNFRMRAFLATMGFNSIMAVCSSVIVTCSYLIIAHFRNTDVEWSGKTKRMQLQLFQTLVLQMIVPMIFVYFPCAGIINLPMLGFRLNVFPNLVSASLTFFPLIDAFIIMFGVKSYRLSVLHFFNCTTILRITASSASNQNTSKAIHPAGLEELLMSTLGDFTSSDRLRFLVDFLTDGGRQKHRFENFSIQNISTWMLAGGFPKGHMRVFGYPSENPYYVFMIEESKYQFPHVQVRTPSAGHDSVLLKESLSAVLEMLTPDLEKHGQILLESDTTIRAMFFELQSEGAPFDTVYYGDFFPFFMDEEQKRKVAEIEFGAPKGFRIDSVDIANDYDKMHSVWPYRATAPPEILRLRLENLPSVCVRADDGNLASWEMSHAFGQLTHLFTLEPYRGKGVGLLAENLLAQIFARKGLQIYKYVVDTNVDVVKGTMKHPLWSTWKSLKNGKESDDKEKDIMWSFNIFKYRKGKEN